MNINTAYFAGGCFWCMTKPFDQFEGIESVTSVLWEDQLKIQPMNK